MAFYTYQLIDPRNNKVFYVGKGRGNRMYEHEREVLRGKPLDSAKRKLIADIHSSGNEVTHKMVERFSDEQEALDAEAIMIANIGLKSLTNTMPRGCKSAHDMAGVGIGRQYAAACMGAPCARSDQSAYGVSSQDVHSMLAGVYQDVRRSKIAKRFSEGVSRYIESKCSGMYSPLSESQHG